MRSRQSSREREASMKAATEAPAKARGPNGKIAPPLKEAAQRGQGYLLSPGADAFMIGGASIALLFLSFILVDRATSILTVSWAAYYLSFVVNWPHFLSSYQLLYIDNREKLLKEARFAWAAFGAPALLIGVLVYFIATASSA